MVWKELLNCTMHGANRDTQPSKSEEKKTKEPQARLAGSLLHPPSDELYAHASRLQAATCRAATLAAMSCTMSQNERHATRSRKQTAGRGMPSCNLSRDELHDEPK